MYRGLRIVGWLVGWLVGWKMVAAMGNRNGARAALAQRLHAKAFRLLQELSKAARFGWWSKPDVAQMRGRGAKAA